LSGNCDLLGLKYTLIAAVLFESSESDAFILAIIYQ